MQTVILSPHFDDAVLSCWHLLEGGGDVTVVNVFSGSPPAGTPVPVWDRLTGADDPVTRMDERRAEDRRALALAGRRSVDLGLLDRQYDSSARSTPSLVTRLEALLTPGAVVHAPAGIGRHPDHETVRAAALELARHGRRVLVYADLPHAIPRGWPGWVAGTPEGPGLGAGAEWSGVLTRAGLKLERLVPRVRPLDAPARARKLRALAEYGTQRAALDLMAFVPLEDPRALAFEVSWEVPRSALGCADERGGERRVADARREPLHDRR